MFCQHCSNNLCTTVSLVDNKPHFFQHCQIVCTVSWEFVYHSEGKNVKVVGTIRLRIADSDIQTTFPGSTSAMSYFSVKAIMLPLQEELWRVFSPKQQTFWPGSLPYWGDDENKCYNNTKFIAIWRLLHFNTKIHSCAPNIFFVGKDMLQSKFERNFLEGGNLICQG